MPTLARKPRAQVYGQDLRAPRVTADGLRLALLYLGAPALAFILALDLLVGAVVWATTGACVSLVCLL